MRYGLRPFIKQTRLVFNGLLNQSQGNMVATKLLMNVKTVFRLLFDKCSHYSVLCSSVPHEKKPVEEDLLNLLNWTSLQTLWKDIVYSKSHKHGMERVTLIRDSTAK